MSLKDITRQQVENLADTALVFQRGQSYLAAGAITKFQVGPGGESIRARVAGSEGLYQVEITETKDDLETDCTCPYDGYVCKHVVAVLLFYLEQRKTNNLTDNIQSGARQSASGSALAQTLQKMEHLNLVELLLRLSEQNDAFRRILLDNIIISPQIIREQPLNSAAVRRLESEITRYFRHLPQVLDEYYESEELDEIDDFLDQIGTFNPHDQLELLWHLLEAGNEVLDEYGINAVQLGQALNSYGQAAGLLSLSAKEKQAYFDRMLQTLKDLEIWDYGAELEDLKAGLDALASTPEDYSYLLKNLKILVTEFSDVADWVADYYLKLGDDQNYLAVRQANLTTEAHYLELADYWRGKGDEAKYLETLENWLIKLAENKEQRQSAPFSWDSLSQNGVVLERLAEYYRAQRDDENLLRILMAQAEYRQPNLGLYRQVEEVADRLKRWQTVRKRFLGLISPYDQKILAEIYLYEKDWQAAIELARQQTGYGQEDVKSLVANGVQQQRPEAAIELYISLVGFNIERANRKYYQMAAQYAANIKEVYLQILKDPSAWQQYIGRIREANKRRYALLDEFKTL